MCMITGFESIQSLFDDSFPVFFCGKIERTLYPLSLKGRGLRSKKEIKMEVKQGV